MAHAKGLVRHLSASKPIYNRLYGDYTPGLYGYTMAHNCAKCVLSAKMLLSVSWRSMPASVPHYARRVGRSRFRISINTACKELYPA